VAFSPHELAPLRLSASGADDILIVGRINRRNSIVPPVSAVSTGTKTAAEPPAIIELGAPCSATPGSGS